MNKKTEQSFVIPLNKYIAQAGVCSRRKAVDCIKAGYVTVNGRIVREPGFKVQEQDQVKVKNKIIRFQELMYIVLNKPRGVVTTAQDEQGRQTVLELIKLPKHQRIYPVGRLDINTTGVLLLTNDGSLAQQLAHPSYRISKVYDVTLDRAMLSEHVEMIEKGIKLKDGIAQVDDCFILPGVKANKIRITLHSGKYRIVRRIFEHMGYKIKKLDRISFAGISKKGLAAGSWRRLTASEVRQVKQAART